MVKRKENSRITMRTACCIIAIFSVIGFGFGQDKGGYPGLPFENVEIGMTKDALEALDGNIKFMEMGNGRAVGVLKTEKQSCLFYLNEGKLVQVSYGWNDLEEADQKVKTEQMLNGFAARFGQPVKSEGVREANAGPVTVATRKYKVGSSNEAVIESWGKTISITVASAEEVAKSEKRLNARIRAMQSKVPTNKNVQERGVVSFGQNKLKKGEQAAAQSSKSEATKDYIEELDK